MGVCRAAIRSFTAFALVAACGDGAETTIDAAAEADAPPPGADADAPAVDAAPPAPVTITVKRAGVPVSNLLVVFSDPAGALVSSSTTDAAGIVSAMVPVGGMVTVADVAISGRTPIYTIAGVQPGEALEAALEPIVTTTDPVTATIELTPFTGAAGHTLHGGCIGYGLGPNATSTSFTFSSPCLDAEREYSVLALAQDAAGTVLAWSQIADAAASSATSTLPAWNTNVATATMQVTGLGSPSWLTTTATVLLRGTTRGWWYRETAASEGSAETSLIVPAGAGDAVVFLQQLTLPRTGGLDRREWYWAVVAPSAVSTHTWALDLAADPMPYASDVVVDVEATAGPTLSWTVVGTRAGVDALAGEVTTDEASWRLVVPPDWSGPIVLPALPAPLDALRPSTTDAAHGSVEVLDALDVATPSAFRTHGVQWLRLVSHHSTNVSDPPLGRLRSGLAGAKL
ncbi:MAG: hypothetical protein SFX73_24600 [Kofleriaceae bacterium]|nr:hypothetical protein [Kofleriaceae bacterium]